MNEIEQCFQVQNITDSPDYYLGNELVKIGNKIHVYSRIMSRKYFEGIRKNMGISRRNYYH